MPSHPADTKFFEILIINEKSNYVTQDFILKHIDRLLTQEEFERVDTILQTVGPTWESRQLYVMLSLLTSTLAAHEKLPNRSQFYRATRQRVLKDHSEHDTNMILRGLLPEKTEEVKKLPPARGSVAEEIQEYRANASKLLSQSRIQFEIEYREQEIVRHQSMIEFLKSIGN